MWADAGAISSTNLGSSAFFRSALAGPTSFFSRM
jgi:hypothetical protein